jgi:hypothetical protein
MSALEGWENFYIIVGPSAGALIGLQFVVITLIAGTPGIPRDLQAGNAFTTPSVVHFAIVLLLSAIVSIPWEGIAPVAVLWGLMGLYGIIYTVIVGRRMRGQTGYEPVFEDWLYHFLLPFAAYAGLLAAAGMAVFHERPALLVTAVAVLLLLFIGIHNAWDAVMYHVFVRNRDQNEPSVESKKE